MLIVWRAAMTSLRCLICDGSMARTAIKSGGICAECKLAVGATRDIEIADPDIVAKAAKQGTNWDDRRGVHEPGTLQPVTPPRTSSQRKTCKTCGAPVTQRIGTELCADCKARADQWREKRDAKIVADVERQIDRHRHAQEAARNRKVVCPACQRPTAANGEACEFCKWPLTPRAMADATTLRKAEAALRDLHDLAKKQRELMRAYDLMKLEIANLRASFSDMAVEWTEVAAPAVNGHSFVGLNGHVRPKALS
jgi:hypothetical protein